LRPQAGHGLPLGCGYDISPKGKLSKEYCDTLLSIPICTASALNIDRKRTNQVLTADSQIQLDGLDDWYSISRNPR
jgi:hypothetical protein